CSSAKTMREPLVHFATPQICAGSDASSFGPDCTDATESGCACDPQADNPCTAGPGGTCIYHGVGRGWWCGYDHCVAPGDCGSGSTCLCSGAQPAYLINRCAPSNCRVDSDCGAGSYCSPTVAQPSGYCGFIGATYAGAYCHTANDECTDDSDCTNGATFEPYDSPACAFDPEANKWTCQSFVCVAG
ncbi:MAG: hypothetical protein ACRELY_30625, partial [Polyangiaceae bacterium]